MHGQRVDFIQDFGIPPNAIKLIDVHIARMINASLGVTKIVRWSITSPSSPVSPSYNLRPMRMPNFTPSVAGSHYLPYAHLPGSYYTVSPCAVVKILIPYDVVYEIFFSQASSAILDLNANFNSRL